MREVEHEAQLLGDLNLGRGHILALHDRSLCLFLFVTQIYRERAWVHQFSACGNNGTEPYGDRDQPPAQRRQPAAGLAVRRA